MRDKKGRFIKGTISWIKGKKIDRIKYPNFGHNKPHTENTKLKMSLSKKGKHYSIETEFKEKKGELSYVGLHEWINRRLGKAKKCSNNINHISTKYCWANISGEYKKEISDWKEVCNKCNLNDGVKIHSRYI